MRSLTRHLTLLLSSLVVAGGTVAAVAAPAQAGSSEAISTSRGTVSWAHYGDKISASDTKKDGISIEANYRRVNPSGFTHILHVAGAGKTASRVWDLFEGQDIQIRMCYRDGLVILKCSGWQNAEA